eukprot:4720844-Pyramimonas_sp.AAC.1
MLLLRRLIFSLVRASVVRVGRDVAAAEANLLASVGTQPPPQPPGAAGHLSARRLRLRPELRLALLQRNTPFALPFYNVTLHSTCPSAT